MSETALTFHSSHSHDLELKVTEVLSKIQAFPHYEKYEMLKKGSLRKSASEDDWNLCLFLLRFIDDKKEMTYAILQEILLRERFREKLNRQDYLKKYNRESYSLNDTQKKTANDNVSRARTTRL